MRLLSAFGGDGGGSFFFHPRDANLKIEWFSDNTDHRKNGDADLKIEWFYSYEDHM
jgi:hypothetical protein